MPSVSCRRRFTRRGSSEGRRPRDPCVARSNAIHSRVRVLHNPTPGSMSTSPIRSSMNGSNHVFVFANAAVACPIIADRVVCFVLPSKHVRTAAR